MILGLLTVASLVWYLLTARTSGDLHLIGTVDANEVLVSAKIPGRIDKLLVQEGDQVEAGQLIAVIESNDLAAARAAAEATVAGQQQKLNETVETERQTKGETTSATVNAQAQVTAAQAALAQAEATWPSSRRIPNARWRWRSRAS
jgi:HlyD family secretion protein